MALSEWTLDPREDFRTFRCDGNRVLEMCGGTSIERNHGPAVSENLHLLGSQIDHRLVRNHQARLHLWPLTSLDVVQNRRVLMQRAADPMTAEFSNDAEVMLVGKSLNCGGHIAEKISGHGRFDRLVERALGHGQKVLHFRSNLT